jgi:hypothetical protein
MLKRLLLVTLAVVGLLTSGAPSEAQTKPRLLVLVTSPNPMVHAMAMLLTREALTRQTPVRMVLCGAGGDLAFSGYAGPVFQPAGVTAQQMLRGVIQAGAQVQICPLYLANTPGANAAGLIEGVTPTTPADVGAYMDGPDVRYLNF